MKILNVESFDQIKWRCYHRKADTASLNPLSKFCHLQSDQVQTASQTDKRVMKNLQSDQLALRISFLTTYICYILYILYIYAKITNELYNDAQHGCFSALLVKVVNRVLKCTKSGQKQTLVSHSISPPSYICCIF